MHVPVPVCVCVCGGGGRGGGPERLEVEVNQTERLMLFIYYKVSLVLFSKFFYTFKCLALAREVLMGIQHHNY